MFGPAQARCLFGNTVVGVEALLKLLAVLVRGVVAEHLAVRRALERLEARLALDCLGGGVLHAGLAPRLSEGGGRGCVRPSAGSLPPWDPRRPCGRASAVPCECVSGGVVQEGCGRCYFAPLPMVSCFWLSVACGECGYVGIGVQRVKFLVECEAWQSARNIAGRGWRGLAVWTPVEPFSPR